MSEEADKYSKFPPFTTRLMRYMENVTPFFTIAGQTPKILWMNQKVFDDWVEAAHSRVVIAGSDGVSTQFLYYEGGSVKVEPSDQIEDMVVVGEPWPATLPKYRDLSRMEAVNITKIAFNTAQQWIKEQGYETTNWNAIAEDKDARSTLMGYINFFRVDLEKPENERQGNYMEIVSKLKGFSDITRDVSETAWELFRCTATKMIDMACRLPEAKQMETPTTIASTMVRTIADAPRR